MGNGIPERAAQSWWKRRNWWKIGFFVLLFVFEVSREIIVIQADASAKPSVSFHLFRFRDFTSAEGVWKRTDNGGKMSSAIIKVECNQSQGSCTMVDVQMNELWVSPPNISRFDAKFTPDSITFDDDSAECVTLKFRIDLTLKKVNAIREQKPNTPDNELCGKIEKRIDLTLANPDYSDSPTDKHFLPILSVLAAILKLS